MLSSGEDEGIQSKAMHTDVYKYKELRGNPRLWVTGRFSCCKSLLDVPVVSAQPQGAGMVSAEFVRL